MSDVKYNMNAEIAKQTVQDSHIKRLTEQLAECEKENSEYVEIHRRLESHDDKWEAEYKQKITSLEQKLSTARDAAIIIIEAIDDWDYKAATRNANYIVKMINKQESGNE